jgi:hypothetical protein
MALAAPASEIVNLREELVHGAGRMVDFELLDPPPLSPPLREASFQ